MPTLKHLGVEIFQAASGALVFDAKCGILHTNDSNIPLRSSDDAHVHLRKDNPDHIILVTTVGHGAMERTYHTLTLDKMTALAISHKLRALVTG